MSEASRYRALHDSLFIWINQKMKVIGHQAITKNISVRSQIFLDFTQKINVIGSGKEDKLTIIATIIQVANFIRLKLHKLVFK